MFATYALAFSGPVDPVKPGGAEKLGIIWFSGATCSIAIRYPSGGTQKLAAKVIPAGLNAGVAWSWTVPTNSGYGTATITASCTYVGATRTEKVPFTIVAPATPTPVAWAFSANGMGSLSDTARTIGFEVITNFTASCTWAITLPDGTKYSGTDPCSATWIKTVPVPPTIPTGTTHWQVTATYKGQTRAANGNEPVPPLPTPPPS